MNELAMTISHDTQASTGDIVAICFSKTLCFPGSFFKHVCIDFYFSRECLLGQRRSANTTQLKNIDGRSVRLHMVLRQSWGDVFRKGRVFQVHFPNIASAIFIFRANERVSVVRSEVLAMDIRDPREMTQDQSASALEAQVMLKDERENTGFSKCFAKVFEHRFLFFVQERVRGPCPESFGRSGKEVRPRTLSAPAIPSPAIHRLPPTFRPTDTVGQWCRLFRGGVGRYAGRMLLHEFGCIA